MIVRNSRFRASRKWTGRAYVWACCLVVFQGCYVYTAPSVPAAGTPLRIELNDNGRVGLGASLGPAVRTVEGTTISNSDSAFLIRVSKVGYMSGQASNWTGEPLMIPRTFVVDVKERQFSRSRTWLTAAVALGAVVTFATTRGLLGSGNDGKEGGNPTPPAQ